MEIFGFKRSLIECTFTDDKLHDICISYNLGAKAAYDKILNNLEVKYGPSDKGSVILIPGEEAHRYWKFEDYNLGIVLYENDLVTVRYWYSSR